MQQELLQSVIQLNHDMAFRIALVPDTADCINYLMKVFMRIKTIKSMLNMALLFAQQIICL